MLLSGIVEEDELLGEHSDGEQQQPHETDENAENADQNGGDSDDEHVDGETSKDPAVMIAQINSHLVGLKDEEVLLEEEIVKLNQNLEELRGEANNLVTRFNAAVFQLRISTLELDEAWETFQEANGTQRQEMSKELLRAVELSEQVGEFAKVKDHAMRQIAALTQQVDQLSKLPTFIGGLVSRIQNLKSMVGTLKTTAEESSAKYLEFIRSERSRIANLTFQTTPSNTTTAATAEPGPLPVADPDVGTRNAPAESAAADGSGDPSVLVLTETQKQMEIRLTVLNDWYRRGLVSEAARDAQQIDILKGL
eukprot:c9631_g1_i1.p1 GENE.c9631_g1_i1~~c9631_g1_i1.p1  ORF type:complete len:309 (-),score=106.05 c9631_g1_i1:52-978(-)